MAHQHGHNHNHHSHDHGKISLNGVFIVGITLNIIYVAAEFIAGFVYDSVGLISDAGHNLGDVASLALAMFAFRLSKVDSNKKYTYGYKKSTVIVSLLNAIILLIAVAFILKESIEKIMEPRHVEGGAVAWVAGIGVLINAFTVYLFIKYKEKDLNVKGAYLHMIADALVSVGVVISGIIIIYTGWYIIDPVIGIIIALIIIYSTWGLLRDSIRLALDGVPIGVDVKEVEKLILSSDNVKDIHHLHIWAISTTDTALTVHVMVDGFSNIESIKSDIKHKLGNYGIGHSTLEFEIADTECECRKC
ncbi:MAG: cation diffusion facilitator family transporter [Rikenellaceae bacterium]|nr:cation diffusion facilitator family transporter [Rikenellaceae bacterium]